MEFLKAITIDPFVSIAQYPLFFFEVLVGGLLAGVMYSLVALGFVLIFKASGVFNFAQGAMVLTAALTFVGLNQMGLPLILALIATIAVMVLLAVAIERGVLRPLVNQPPIILFMATIGISYVLDGVSQIVWGSDVKVIELGIPGKPMEIGGILINQFDLFAAATAGTLVFALAVFFQKTAIGRALRAVADDHQAAPDPHRREQSQHQARPTGPQSRHRQPGTMAQIQQAPITAFL